MANIKKCPCCKEMPFAVRVGGEDRVSCSNEHCKFHYHWFSKDAWNKYTYREEGKQMFRAYLRKENGSDAFVVVTSSAKTAAHLIGCNAVRDVLEDLIAHVDVERPSCERSASVNAALKEAVKVLKSTSGEPKEEGCENG